MPCRPIVQAFIANIANTLRPVAADPTSVWAAIFANVVALLERDPTLAALLDLGDGLGEPGLDTRDLGELGLDTCDLGELGLATSTAVTMPSAERLHITSTLPAIVGFGAIGRSMPIAYTIA